MAKANKKQRHEAKRKAKKLQARRREAISPIKRLAESPGEVECWMSVGFEEFGQTQIFAYKSAGGLSGFAAFLVDQGVVGLKDAWHDISVDRAMLERMMDDVKSSGMKMIRCKLDEARRWVAGAARWAHDNGMRLPKEWQKTASLIGGVGDWQSADVSNFVMEFAGHPEDLRQRLVGESFESYLNRKDVVFTFSDDAPFMDQETGDYVDYDDDDDDEFDADAPLEEFGMLRDSMEKMTSLLVAETHDWLKGQDEIPEPELAAAWSGILIAKFTQMQFASDDRGLEIFEAMLEQLDETRREKTMRALQQAIRHMTAVPNLAERVANQLPADGREELEWVREESIESE